MSDWRTSTLPRSFDSFFHQLESNTPSTPRSRARARSTAPTRHGLQVDASTRSFFGTSAQHFRAGTCELEHAVIQRAQRADHLSGAASTLLRFQREGRLPLQTSVELDRSAPGLSNAARASAGRVALPQKLRDQLQNTCSALPPVSLRKRRPPHRSTTPLRSLRTHQLSQPKSQMPENTETAYTLYTRASAQRKQEVEALAADCCRVHLPVASAVQL
jgi:hypothetical protein